MNESHLSSFFLLFFFGGVFLYVPIGSFYVFFNVESGF